MGRGKERLLYIDNLRLLMIVFVVIIHLAVTYSGFGSWYYKEGRALGPLSTLLFGFWQSFTQGYFMGLLFLIAGYFVPGAYDRKGFGSFVNERLIRLGVPALIYMLAINPFILYVQLGLTWVRPKPGLLAFYAGYVGRLEFLGGSGPLWFVLALLIFSVVYGLIRLIPGSRPVAHREQRIKPGLINAIMLILIIAVSAFLIRLVQPIGTSILNMQLCYFASYIILFILGVLAYRSDLLVSLDYGYGRRWLIAGLALGFVAWLVIMVAGGALQGHLSVFNGGLTWQSLVYALWESFVAVAICIGLIALFREKYNRQSGLVKVLSDNSFAVYVFHPPIIIAVAQLFRPVAFLPIIKFVILCVICLPLCFAAAHFVVRKIPLLKSVM